MDNCHEYILESRLPGITQRSFGYLCMIQGSHYPLLTQIRMHKDATEIVIDKNWMIDNLRSIELRQNW